jgi:tetratricopeptide (TPR) repeat protein
MNKAKEYMDAHMYSEAISLLEIEIQANPKNVEAYYLAAQCYIELNNTYQAEEYFNKAILLDTDYRAKIGEFYYEKAFKLYTENNYSPAESIFNKAVKYNPEGKNGFAQKLFDYATDISETATKANEVTNIYNFVTSIDNQFNEDIASKCANLSKSLYEKGFYEESFNYGEFSIRYDPGFINQLADLYESYAKKLLEVPDKSYDAINYFDRSLKLNSSNRSKIASIFYDYSQKYESQNNTELTLLFAETCFNLDNKYEKYYDEITVKYKPKYSTESLLAYYPFNGNAYDESGNEKFCTVQGASLTTDRFNKVNSAYHFNGNSYISIDGGLGKVDEFTISAWILVEQKSNDFYAILSGTDWGNFLHFQITDNPQGGIGIYASPNYFDIPRVPLSPIGKWRHVVLSSRSGHIVLYENGQVLSISGNTYNYVGQSSPILIGAGYRYGRFFVGKIDDIFVYNRALSENEVKSLFQIGGWTRNQ